MKNKIQHLCFENISTLHIRCQKTEDVFIQKKKKKNRPHLCTIKTGIKPS